MVCNEQRADPLGYVQTIQNRCRYGLNACPLLRIGTNCAPLHHDDVIEGCDYQFQNAELVYRSTDWIIDTINAHPEWGVHVQYTTPREYLAKVKASAVATDTKFPVKTNGSHFFPYGDWSGYFTSRCVCTVTESHHTRRDMAITHTL